MKILNIKGWNLNPSPLISIVVDNKKRSKITSHRHISTAVMFALFLPSIANASVISDTHPSVISLFAERLKAIFLASANENDQQDTVTSQNLTLMKSGSLEDDSSEAVVSDESSDDVLSVTSGSLRFSTEELDIPLNDTISRYEVKKGDTLSTVAKLFGVSKNTIIWANDLKSQVINPGDTLIILPITGIKHTVKKGDTLASITRKYKADAEDIAKYNGISQDSDLSVGSVILVPEGELSITSTVKSKSGKKVTKSRILDSYSYSAPSGFFTRPVLGGHRTQGLHGHNGIDIGATPGTPVVASANGTVIFAKIGGYNGGYGNMIIISHDGGVQTLYSHLREVNVSVGQSVTQGQIIGGVGNTGRSTGPHLHFEVRGAKNPF